jgi:hypothetical protein
MQRQRIAMASAAAMGALGTFLPWIHAPFVGEVTGALGDGRITLSLYALTILLALADRPREHLSHEAAMAMVAPAVAASAFGAVDGFKVMTLKEQILASADNPFAAKLAGAMTGMVTPGMGLFLVACSGVAALGFALIEESVAPARTGALAPGVSAPRYAQVPTDPVLLGCLVLAVLSSFVPNDLPQLTFEWVSATLASR